MARVFTDMKGYITLLRRTDINRENKVSMAELEKDFEDLTLGEVGMYLSSGNVIFPSDENNTEKFTAGIRKTMKNQLGLEAPVLVVSRETLEDILHDTPDWWGSDDKEIRDSPVFMIPPVKLSNVYHKIEEPEKGLEKIEGCKKTVLWPFSRKDY